MQDAMNHKLFIISILSFTFCPLYAQFKALTPIQDSIFMDTDTFGIGYISYKVNKNQTLYSLSKCFRVSIDSIIHLNPELKDSPLKEGSSLKIPLHKSIITHENDSNNTRIIKLFYKVKAGENLYHLSKRKFNVSLPVLVQLNKLNTSSIRENMDLIIGYYEMEELRSPDSKVSQSNPDLPTLSVEPFALYQFSKSAKGVAISQQDKLGSGRLFALHNEAQMDSYIEIENPILNRKIYAKVIGRIPPIYERDIQVVISSEGAKLLGAVDKRFFISLRYR
jgi:LysM repeat protein